MRLKKLYLSFANPKTWRSNIKEKITRKEWEYLRLKILKRDDYTCKYCEFKSEKHQIVHHIDGNPNNNRKVNLETICPMCNSVHHSGLATIHHVIQIYKISKYSQNEIIQITRKMRDKNETDEKIISYLELKYPEAFMMNRAYLKRLFGFPTNTKWKNKNKCKKCKKKIKRRERCIEERIINNKKTINIFCKKCFDKKHSF